MSSIAKHCKRSCRDLADRVFDEHERVVPPLNKQIWKIDREIRKILLDQVLLYELEIQEKAAAGRRRARLFRSCLWRHEDRARAIRIRLSSHWS